MKPGLHPGFISVTFSIYTNKSFINITYPKSGNYISFNKKRSILTANTSLLSKKKRIVVLIQLPQSFPVKVNVFAKESCHLNTSVHRNFKILVNQLFQTNITHMITLCNSWIAWISDHKICYLHDREVIFTTGKGNYSR